MGGLYIACCCCCRSSEWCLAAEELVEHSRLLRVAETRSDCMLDLDICAYNLQPGEHPRAAESSSPSAADAKTGQIAVLPWIPGGAP